MKLLSEILIIVLPVFLVIGVGAALKATPLIGGEFLFQLNRLVYFLALPLLLFYKISTADFSSSFNGPLVSGLIISTAAGFILSYGYASMRSYPPSIRGSFSQGAFRGNLAYIGLAMVYNAYGEKGLASAGILLGFIVPTLNFFSVLALVMPYRQGERRMESVAWIRQICGNPLIIASFAGIAWSFFHLPMPAIIDSALHIVTGMALPLALLSIGASFSLTRLRGDLKTIVLATAFKLVALPFLAALVLFVLGVRGQDFVIGVLFAGTPTATAAYIMAQQMKGDPELSGSIIMLTTLLSIITFSFILYCLKTMGL